MRSGISRIRVISSRVGDAKRVQSVQCLPLYIKEVEITGDRVCNRIQLVEPMSNLVANSSFSESDEFIEAI